MRLPRFIRRKGQHGSGILHVRRSRRRTAAPALVALLAAAGLVPGTVDAQDRASGEPAIEDIPGETLVARFGLPPEALDRVTSSVELVVALRQHLAIDLAMPLNEPLVFTLHGMAGRQEGGPGPVYHFGLSSLGVGFKGEDPLDDFSYAHAVRETHGDDFPADGDEWEEFDADDWDEEEAWNSLVKALDLGLPQSSDRFEPIGEGEHIGLVVTEMHLREFTIPGLRDEAGWLAFQSCCEDLDDRPVLLIRPEPQLQSMMTAGDDPTGDVPIRLNVLALELAPTSAAAAPASGSGLAAPSAEADAEALAMTETLQGACHAPQLANADAVSTSELVIEGEPRTGEAVFAVDGEVDHVFRLGGGEADARFCMILMGRGGPSETGTYPVQKLSTDRMQNESDPAQPRMVASLSFGPRGETLFVAESGFVEVIEMEPSIRGRFELEGWVAHVGTRAEAVKVTGYFDAPQAATATNSAAQSPPTGSQIP